MGLRLVKSTVSKTVETRFDGSREGLNRGFGGWTGGSEMGSGVVL